MSVNSKFNEKQRAKLLEKGQVDDFYYARVTEYERRHVECDGAIRPVFDTRGIDAQCNCSKWHYNYVTGKMEKVGE